MVSSCDSRPVWGRNQTLLGSDTTILELRLLRTATVMRDLMHALCLLVQQGGSRGKGVT